MGRDVGRGFQHHPLGRPMHPVIAGFAGVAHRTAALHNGGDIGKPRCCGIDQTHGRQSRRLGRMTHRRGGQPDNRQKQHPGQCPCPMRVAFAGVAAVEPVPHRDPHQEHQRGDHPVVFGGKNQRVMDGQHQKNDRQGQIVVMGGPLLGDLAIFRVRLAPRLQIGHHNPLVRHDDEKHIRTHDRGGKRAQMQKRRPAREDLRIAPGHAHQNHIKPQHQARVVIAKPAFADQVIDHPAKRQ